MKLTYSLFLPGRQVAPRAVRELKQEYAEANINHQVAPCGRGLNHFKILYVR